MKIKPIYIYIININQDMIVQMEIKPLKVWLQAVDGRRDLTLIICR